MFKVGDKVKVIKNDSHSGNMVGDVGTITKIDDRGYIKVTVDDRFDCRNFHYPHDLEHFGPVRETTIVKKEIIPGVYGKVQVFGSGYISTELIGDKTELAEAIKTLQLIHDAME